MTDETSYMHVLANTTEQIKNEINGIETQTISEIVTKDIRKADVFKKYNIDFCCGGKISLADACKEKNLDINEVKLELEKLNVSAGFGPFLDFINWEPEFLADYIFNQHHKFYYRNAAPIKDLAEKVAFKHGDLKPELKELAIKVSDLQMDLNQHFLKEETVIFPLIKNLKNNTGIKATNEQKTGSLNSMLKEMENDHQVAGDLLADIKKLTNNFTPPNGCCNSMALLYSKLSDLDNDLRRHIHLENNILFPKALNLEKTLAN